MPWTPHWGRSNQLLVCAQKKCSGLWSWPPKWPELAPPVPVCTSQCSAVPVPPVQADTPGLPTQHCLVRVTQPPPHPQPTGQAQDTSSPCPLVGVDTLKCTCWATNSAETLSRLGGRNRCLLWVQQHLCSLCHTDREGQWAAGLCRTPTLLQTLRACFYWDW